MSLYYQYNIIKLCPHNLFIRSYLSLSGKVYIVLRLQSCLKLHQEKREQMHPLPQPRPPLESKSLLLWVALMCPLTWYRVVADAAFCFCSRLLMPAGSHKHLFHSYTVFVTGKMLWKGIMDFINTDLQMNVSSVLHFGRSGRGVSVGEKISTHHCRSRTCIAFPLPSM